MQFTFRGHFTQNNDNFLIPDCQFTHSFCAMVKSKKRRRQLILKKYLKGNRWFGWLKFDWIFAITIVFSQDLKMYNLKMDNLLFRHIISHKNRQPGHSTLSSTVTNNDNNINHTTLSLLKGIHNNIIMFHHWSSWIHNVCLMCPRGLLNYYY